MWVKVHGGMGLRNYFKLNQKSYAIVFLKKGTGFHA
jgi:hypothetical protein